VWGQEMDEKKKIRRIVPSDVRTPKLFRSKSKKAKLGGEEKKVGSGERSLRKTLMGKK